MIAISAGHFGIGTGAVGFVDEVKEARKVVEHVTMILQKEGVAVTKIIDTTSKNQQQNLFFLRKQHASVRRKVDVFVHFNASAKKQIAPIGTEVLFKDISMQPLAQKLAASISQASGLKNRGAKVNNQLYLLKNSKVGAVLIEICFVNSKVDVQLYKQHFHEICQAISDVLKHFVTVHSGLHL